MITKEMINTIMPKIICSNHSYGVRPFARFLNRLSRNTEPPLAKLRRVSLVRMAVCHAYSMVQNRVLMGMQNECPGMLGWPFNSLLTDLVGGDRSSHPAWR